MYSEPVTLRYEGRDICQLRDISVEQHRLTSPQLPRAFLPGMVVDLVFPDKTVSGLIMGDSPEDYFVFLEE